MSSLNEFAKKAQDKEEKRIGDVYDECVKRGCERQFLVQFNTRIAEKSQITKTDTK